MGMDSATIELRPRASGPAEGTDEPASNDARLEFLALPPVDGGKDAWLFLGACFVIEALIWGT